LTAKTHRSHKLTQRKFQTTHHGRTKKRNRAHRPPSEEGKSTHRFQSPGNRHVKFATQAGNPAFGSEAPEHAASSRHQASIHAAHTSGSSQAARWTSHAPFHGIFIAKTSKPSFRSRHQASIHSASGTILVDQTRGVRTGVKHFPGTAETGTKKGNGETSHTRRRQTPATGNGKHSENSAFAECQPRIHQDQARLDHHNFRPAKRTGKPGPRNRSGSDGDHRSRNPALDLHELTRRATLHLRQHQLPA
jgi:hypothetical protein